MAKKSTNRVGQNMKPREKREIQRDNPVLEEKHADRKSGQQTSKNVPLLEGKKSESAAVSGVPLEAENEMPDSVLATSDEEQKDGFGSVARSDGNEPDSSLSELMKASREPFQKPISVELSPKELLDLIKAPTGFDTSVRPASPEEIAALGGGADISHILSVKAAIDVLGPPSLGDQPDGQFRGTVLIREGYIEGIRQTAEVDNQTVEEWLSSRLGEYLESWWFGK